MRSTAFLSATCLLAFAGPSHAEGMLSGVVTRMSIGPAGPDIPNALVITATNSAGTRPSCASTAPTLMAYDLSKESSRSQAQLLTAAHIVGQSVQVFGTGACTIYPHIEDALYMLTDR